MKFVTGYPGRLTSNRVNRVAVFAALLWVGNAHAADATAVTYMSPNGVEEHCVALRPIPYGVYTEKDRREEQRFCRVDFYDGMHALCPKVFSTSPGTLVYDISRGPFAGRPEAFEAEQCATSSPLKRGAVGEPIVYKTTMNEAQTSATFSTSSLLYYHFARYFDAAVHVPVSVYRSIDKEAHLERVTLRGEEMSARRRGGAMNHGGWVGMREAERAPETYPATDELFTTDRKQIYGVLLHPDGDRYSAEINGTRKSGWGAGQNRDFQKTAPFLALRADRPLFEAIEHGIHEASADPVLRKAMQHGVSPEQMVFWMQELTEIVLLDYIFSQQDRIGNIDYLNYWYWLEEGEVRRMPAGSSRVPESIADHHPVRLRRTQLNDNDAGGRVQYANFAKKTGMLEKIRHLAPATYRRIVYLDRDFTARGELHTYLNSAFGLSHAQVRQVVDNTRLAATILRDICHTGKLRFDLEPERFLATGRVTEYELDCDQPAGPESP